MREMQAELRAAEAEAEQAMEEVRALYEDGRFLGAFGIWCLLQAAGLCRKLVGWHSRRLLAAAEAAARRPEPPA